MEKNGALGIYLSKIVKELIGEKDMNNLIIHCDLTVI